MMSSRRLSAHVPLTYPVAGSLRVCFMTADLHFSSTKEECSNNPLDYSSHHSSDEVDLHHSDGVEFLRILSKAVDELSLEWVPLAEPARSHLDRWLLQSDRSRENTPRRPVPLLSEVMERATHESSAQSGILPSVFYGRR